MNEAIEQEHVSPHVKAAYRQRGEIKVLVFLVGALLGLLMGGALCARYLRREVAADISPKLKHMQLQLDNIQTELTLANTTRHAELTACPPGNPHASCRH